MNIDRTTKWSMPMTCLHMVNIFRPTCVFGSVPPLISLAHWATADLWGMPMTKLSTPKALEESMMVFMQGMRTSHPSRPKRFSDDHFLARNSSNLKQQVDDVASESLHFINLLLVVVVFTLSGSVFVNVGASELWRILNSLFTSGLDTHMKHGHTHTHTHTHFLSLSLSLTNTHTHTVSLLSLTMLRNWNMPWVVTTSGLIVYALTHFYPCPLHFNFLSLCWWAKRCPAFWTQNSPIPL